MNWIQFKGTDRFLGRPSRHPHIVSLYGALESESHIYIIMERLHINMAQAVERLPHSRVIANMKRYLSSEAT